VVSWSSSVLIVGLWVFTVTASSECHGGGGDDVWCGLDGWSWIFLGSNLVSECFADGSFLRERLGVAVVVGVLSEEVGACWGDFL